MSNLELFSFVIDTVSSPGLAGREDMKKRFVQFGWLFHNFRIFRGLSKEDMDLLVDEYLAGIPVGYYITEDLVIHKVWE